ncbi:MAG: PIN domain-containing protein [Methylobacter sp.]
MSDTNILSELQKGNRCHADVQRWYAAIASNAVLMIDEIRLSIERLRRRDAIQAVYLEQKLLAVETLMESHILPITQAIAERWGRLNAPDPLPVIDGLLAATALEQDLTLVTRNVRDVERYGVRWLNPFSES